MDHLLSHCFLLFHPSSLSLNCTQSNDAKPVWKIWKTLLIVCLPIDWRLSVCVYGVSPTARAAVCWQTWPAAKAIAIIIKIRLTVGNGRGRQVFTVGCYFCNGTHKKITTCNCRLACCFRRNPGERACVCVWVQIFSLHGWRCIYIIMCSITC